jgi:hypothetical protein
MLREFPGIPPIPEDWRKVSVQNKVVGTQKRNNASMLLEVGFGRYFGMPPQLIRKAFPRRFDNAGV